MEDFQIVNPKFQIFTGKDNQFYFRLIARNGEIILKSEGYVAKSGCENGIWSVQVNAPHDKNYRKRTAVDDTFYFNLVAANGEIIGTSETYSFKQMRDKGIEAVKTTAPEAPVDDAS